MIFGKHINRYYLKYALWLIFGLAALVMVDFLQLEIPKLYRSIINGMNLGYVMVDGTQVPFTMDFVLDHICMSMVWIILAMVFGRFLWRICFFGSAVKLEEDLRNRMFDHAKNLSREYYQINKVGNLMSLFTNDLDTVQECFGWGVMMFFDAVLMGVLAVSNMWQMDPLLTILSLIPMVFLMGSATIVGKRLTEKWDTRQEAFSRLSDFSQESFSGIAVIKAFVKEGRELWAFKKLNVENEDANIDHTKTSVLFRVMVMMFFDAVLMGVLAVGNMWQMDPLLTILSLIPMVFLMGSATIVGKRLTEKWDTRQEAFSRLSDFSQESFSGIAVIKAFVKEGRELWAFKKLNVENEDANIDHTKTSVLFRVMVMMFVESVVCVILGYGGYLVWKGSFNAGQLVEFIAYFTAVVWPIMAVSELIDMTSRGKASLDRISELLDAEINVTDRDNVRDLNQVRGDIEFRNLTFRYPDGEYDALRSVSFTIRAGENVGLVGKTGSGKTTLVDLILRTYNVPDGTIFIDNQDVNDVSIRSVRNACAYVPQDNFLFSDTIENNIAFGVGEHTMSSITEAARLADVDSNIKDFQLGYGTILGERGVTVSGGQKQRISIARALMKDAPILILDDSVSAVDTKTETTILENLRRTRAGKTTILIAHRISTIERMDKILFIDEGELVDMGTHEQLYARCPEYQKMVDLQKLEEEGGSQNA